MNYKNVFFLMILPFAFFHSHSYAQGDQATYLIASGLLGATANYMPFGIAFNVQERDQRDLSWNEGVVLGGLWAIWNILALYILNESMPASKVDKEFKGNCYLTYLLGASAGILLPVTQMKTYSKPRNSHNNDRLTSLHAGSKHAS